LAALARVEVRVMDLQRGFEIEDPRCFVEWGISVARLRELLPSSREVTQGYWTLDVTSLSGLRHTLGFHFDPPNGGALVELEFFRGGVELAASYAAFQQHLVATFGPPTRSSAGDNGFASHRWDVEGIEIRHLVVDRFGPEEHVRIRRLRLGRLSIGILHAFRLMQQLTARGRDNAPPPEIARQGDGTPGAFTQDARGAIGTCTPPNATEDRAAGRVVGTGDRLFPHAPKAGWKPGRSRWRTGTRPRPGG
jgi:hypothetical protein